MKITIIGASGKMGKELIKEAINHKELQISAALVRSFSPLLGQDIGLAYGIETDVKYSSDLEEAVKSCDAVIDFSRPEVTMEVLNYTSRHKKIHVIGTTGFSQQQEIAITDCANSATIVKSANMSITVNLIANLAAQAAQKLGSEFDIEILEMHHRQKIDAPSGTALMLGKAILEAKGLDPHENQIFDRHGHVGARPDDKIGYAVVRGGDIVGEHRIIFAGQGERLEIAHISTTRSHYAKGALQAALRAKAKPAGLYGIGDVVKS